PVLSMRDVHKEFYGNTVLKGVSLDVKPGEIHGLVGENGAGKTTLMNILFGMPVIRETGGFTGEVLFKSTKVDFRSPADAMRAGIGMVHQEFMLLPGFTVTENIKLNREITRPNTVSRLVSRRLETLDVPAMRRDSRRALDRLEMSIDEWAPVAGMPVGHMQFIEIAREIDKQQASLLVLDEPTAVLTEGEAANLLRAMKIVASSGIAILFITHRLDEVVEAADRITVLRDGEVVGRMRRDEARVDRIAELMVGRSLEQGARHGDESRLAGAPVLLRIRDLEVDMPGEVVRGVSLDLRKGEILGLGGLAGHGKLGVANGIMGLKPARGALEKNGLTIPLNNPRGALNSGLAFLSEDRRGVGLLLDETIEDNIVVAGMMVQGKFLRRMSLLPLQVRDGKAIRAHASEMVSMLDIRCTSTRQRVRQISGGNQQKICVAKALTLDPDVLLVSEPTRGIDVGAKERVLDELLRLNREKGITILMTSSELNELRKVCDRIAIMHGGRISGILDPGAPDAAFGLAMAGKEWMSRAG
ncbi:MAG: sugar ABC transporter ATP-binding protein, partial [Bacillota bacterium]